MWSRTAAHLPERAKLNWNLLAVGISIALASAAATYFLDPRSGRRRRAVARDRATHAIHRGQHLVDTAWADARNRAVGLYRLTDSRLRPSSGLRDSQVLAERVRSKLGRVCSHPRAIRVASDDGVVTLRGDVLQQDLNAVLRGVRHVHGVRKLVSDLQVHREAGRMPFLQGNAQRAGSHLEFLQSNWSPAPRVLAGAAGAAMVVGGFARRSIGGTAVALCGAGLVVRSIGNLPLSHVLGIQGGIEDGIVIQKTMHVYAELEEVYTCWRQIENFPRFMSHVREVRKVSDTLYHWVVDGPAGIPVEWDAEITADVPGELIAWRTVDGSEVQSSGVVQFEPDAYGDTRVHVRMTYRPPANAVGRTVARIFGVDPRRQMDADLARLKSYLEVGKTTGAYGTVTRH